MEDVRCLSVLVWNVCGQIWTKRVDAEIIEMRSLCFARWCWCYAFQNVNFQSINPKTFPKTSMILNQGQVVLLGPALLNGEINPLPLAMILQLLIAIILIWSWTKYISWFYLSTQLSYLVNKFSISVRHERRGFFIYSWMWRIFLSFGNPLPYVSVLSVAIHFDIKHITG